MTCVVVTFRLYLCRYVVWENYAKVSNYYSIRLHAITSFIWNSDDIFHFAFLHRLFSISYTVYGYLFSLISFNKWQQSDNWLLMKWWVGKLIVQFIVWQEKIISLNNDKIFFMCRRIGPNSALLQFWHIWSFYAKKVHSRSVIA